MPLSRPWIAQDKKQAVCNKVLAPGSHIVFTGIKSILLEKPTTVIDKNDEESNDSLAMSVSNGEITCLGPESECLSSQKHGDIHHIELENGYVTPGLVAFGNNIGIIDISSEPSTGDGSPGRKGNALNEQKDLHFAKYGVHFGGRGFGRARVGGVTKAITAPIFGGGALQGVSVGLRTSENATVLGGGIWKDEVALHFAIGQEAKGQLKQKNTEVMIVANVFKGMTRRPSLLASNDCARFLRKASKRPGRLEVPTSRLPGARCLS